MHMTSLWKSELLRDGAADNKTPRCDKIEEVPTKKNKSQEVYGDGPERESSEHSFIHSARKPARETRVHAREEKTDNSEQS